MAERVTVEHNGERITLEVPDGTSDEQIQQYLSGSKAPGPSVNVAPQAAAIATRTAPALVEAGPVAAQVGKDVLGAGANVVKGSLQDIYSLGKIATQVSPAGAADLFGKLLSSPVQTTRELAGAYFGGHPTFSKLADTSLSSAYQNVANYGKGILPSAKNIGSNIVQGAVAPESLISLPYQMAAYEQEKIRQNPNAPEYATNPYAQAYRGEFPTQGAAGAANRRQAIANAPTGYTPSADEARNILDSGDQRTIQLYGGADRLTQIAAGAATPTKQTSMLERTVGPVLNAVVPSAQAAPVAPSAPEPKYPGIDALPTPAGQAPKSPLAPVAPEQPRNAMEKVIGAGEAAMSIISGTAAPFLGLGKGVVQNIQQGTNERIDRPELAQDFTYQPRTAAGQEYVENVGKVLEASKLPPVMPGMGMRIGIPGEGPMGGLPRVGAQIKPVAPEVPTALPKEPVAVPVGRPVAPEPIVPTVAPTPKSVPKDVMAMEIGLPKDKKGRPVYNSKEEMESNTLFERLSTGKEPDYVYKDGNKTVTQDASDMSTISLQGKTVPAGSSSKEVKIKNPGEKETTTYTRTTFYAGGEPSYSYSKQVKVGKNVIESETWNPSTKYYTIEKQTPTGGKITKTWQSPEANPFLSPGSTGWTHGFEHSPGSTGAAKMLDLSKEPAPSIPSWIDMTEFKD